MNGHCSSVIRSGPSETAVVKARKTNSPALSNSGNFAFIIADEEGRSPSNVRKLIRSHCMRGKNTGKRGRRGRMVDGRSAEVQQSALAPLAAAQDRTVGPVVNVRISPSCTACLAEQDGNASTEVIFLTTVLPGPFKAPSSFALRSLPEHVKFDERQLITSFFKSIKDAIYPVEICFEVHETEDAWYHFLLSDPAYMNSALLMISIFHDILSSSSSHDTSTNRASIISPRSYKYLRRSIEFLKERIDDRDRHMEDATSAIITTLALASEMIGDDAAYWAHNQGMKKIVRLRGGLSNFNSNGKLQVKMCRVDLGWSLKTGSKPQLCDADSISWSRICDDLFTTHHLDHLSSPASSVQKLVENLDEKLYNAFQDMRDFSTLINHLTNMEKKVSPHVFQEIMLSVQYRLLLLDYEVGGLHETIRLGLLTFQTTLFMQSTMKLPFDLHSTKLRAAIENLDTVSSLLADLKLWMLFTGSMGIFDFNDPWLRASIKEYIADAAWPGVRKRLQGIMWTDRIHDGPGQKMFDAVRTEVK